MTSTPLTDPSTVTSLDELYSLFEELSMEGGWHRQSPALWNEPRKNLVPAAWRYATIKSVLDAAGRLVDHSMAERRNVTLTNPAEGNIYPTVRSMVAAYQLIRPDETANAHRHSPSALRIILEGHGTSTVVDGTRLEMRPGDVLLTPTQEWHSHAADGPDDCYWVDILDVPLIHLLEPMFFERHPDGLETDVIDAEQSPLAFRWEDSLARLEAQTAAPEHGMAEREIQLGDPALHTIALHVQQMSAGFHSAAQRTTANSIFTVLQGSGETVVDGEVLNWETGDIIAVPAWRSHQHRADSDAYLVRASDEPVMRAFDLLRSASA